MNEQVLLVEDDASIREVTTLGLEQSGFAVTSAGDGREGLIQFRQGRFDLQHQLRPRMAEANTPGVQGLPRQKLLVGAGVEASSQVG